MSHAKATRRAPPRLACGLTVVALAVASRLQAQAPTAPDRASEPATDGAASEPADEPAPQVGDTRAPEPPSMPWPDDAAGGEQFGATATVHRFEGSASTVVLDARDLAVVPYRGADDMLNAAPGLYVVDHGGGGKAAQYFVRGFDADHGTDVAFRVDGVPENHVSHGHGQGFTNLNWVIPETIEEVRVRKGPYFADVGDFATGAAVDLRLIGAPATDTVTLQAGSFGTLRGVAVVSPELQAVEPTLAAEVVHSDGFFDLEEDLLRANGLARVRRAWDGVGELTATVTTHVSDWRGPGQIPERAVRSGRISRFGSLDLNEGGSSARHSFVLALTDRPAGGPASANRPRFSLTAYAVRSRLALYSDFTFRARNPEAGDMIRQTDERTMLGLDAHQAVRHQVGELAFETRGGLQFRDDSIRNSLSDAPGRQVELERVRAGIGQSAMGLFVEEHVSFAKLGALALGVRGDVMSFAVEDMLDVEGSGERLSGRVSPKAGLRLTPLARPEWLALFGNAGLGFHSNDARGVVAGGVTPMTRALGYELGVQARPWPELGMTAVAFVLDLDSELVWVGDEGTTEPSGQTRRRGLEAEVGLEILPWLELKVDATLVDARFEDAPDGEDSIPLAPTFLLQGAAVVSQRNTGLAGRLGVTHVDDRPATEDGVLTAEGFTRLDAVLRYDQPLYALALSVSNILDTDWRQAQFATTSRLVGETESSDCPAGSRAISEDGNFVGCEEVHYMAGNPIDIQLSATLKF